MQGNKVRAPNYCKFKVHSICQKHISSSSKHDVLKVLFRGKNSINVTTKHKKLQLQKLWVCLSLWWGTQLHRWIPDCQYWETRILGHFHPQILKGISTCDVQLQDGAVWMNLAQDSDKLLALVNPVINIGGLQNVGWIWLDQKLPSSTNLWSVDLFSMSLWFKLISYFPFSYVLNTYGKSEYWNYTQTGQHCS